MLLIYCRQVSRYIQHAATDAGKETRKRRTDEQLSTETYCRNLTELGISLNWESHRTGNLTELGILQTRNFTDWKPRRKEQLSTETHRQNLTELGILQTWEYYKLGIQQTGNLTDLGILQTGNLTDWESNWKPFMHFCY